MIALKRKIYCFKRKKSIIDVAIQTKILLSRIIWKALLKSKNQYIKAYKVRYYNESMKYTMRTEKR